MREIRGSRCPLGKIDEVLLHDDYNIGDRQMDLFKSVSADMIGG
jgi:hypothetical protein